MVCWEYMVDAEGWMACIRVFSDWEGNGRTRRASSTARCQFPLQTVPI